MLRKSKEIRWFTKTEDENIISWFSSHQLHFGKGNREDFYMPLLERQDLGIKVRENKIEIKQRMGKGGIIRLAEKVTGKIEFWDKYSFTASAEDEAMKYIEKGEADWISCKKDRIGLNVYKDFSGKLIYVGLEEIIESGCEIEYSEILVNSFTYYSICFEWFGDLTQDLPAEIATQLLSKTELQQEMSMGYPEFFSSLTSLSS
jgi:hypothetical protein